MASYPTSKEFERWFGKSQVVNPDGSPMRVYHITPANFSTFRAGGMNPMLSGKAIWLSPTPERTNAAHNTMHPKFKKNVMQPHPEMIETPEGRRMYEGTNMMPLYVRAENPLDLWTDYDVESKPNLLAAMKAVNLYVRTVGLPTSSVVLEPVELARAKELGYDSIITRTTDNESIWEIVVFSPNQVKSAIGNRGTYSRRDNNILNG